MKVRSRILLLVCTWVVLFTQCEKDPQIELVDIPDNTFLNALIEVGVDTDGDGEISAAEAEAISYLNISGEFLSGECCVVGDISDLTGIEAFINLDTLDCSYNQITTLDIAKNTALILLNCMENQLTSLDVSNNPALFFLACSLNQLSSLDVSINPGLVEFYCDGNQLTSLDISNNTALAWVYLSDMPSLYEVCVWETPFPPAYGHLVVTENSPNIYFTTECSR